jgi:hypothetical protein
LSARGELANYFCMFKIHSARAIASASDTLTRALSGGIMLQP